MSAEWEHPYSEKTAKVGFLTELVNEHAVNAEELEMVNPEIRKMATLNRERVFMGSLLGGSGRGAGYHHEHHKMGELDDASNHGPSQVQTG